jgi:hypothetical protein
MPSRPTRRPGFGAGIMFHFTYLALQAVVAGLSADTVILNLGVRVGTARRQLRSTGVAIVPRYCAVLKSSLGCKRRRPLPAAFDLWVCARACVS